MAIRKFGLLPLPLRGGMAAENFLTIMA